jgi:hypothetical protein
MTTPLADRLAQGHETLEQELLICLVALNHERAAEEAKGKIRWLRPEYQDPNYKKSEDRRVKLEQSELDNTLPTASKQPWPKDLPAQVAAIHALLPTTGSDANTIAAHFGKRTKKRLDAINQILTTLKNLGQL